MDKRKNITPIKNLAYTFFHWLLVVLLSAISYIIQYSFMTDTGEVYDSFLFLTEIYSINYFTYFIGLILFFVGYYIIWKKYLVVDWCNFREQFWLWKIAFIAIALVSIVGIFVIALMVMFCHLGLTGDIRPVWTTWGYVYFTAYIVLVAIIDLIVTRKK